MIRRSNSIRKCTILFFDICFNFFGFYFKHKGCLVGISDVTSKQKFYCTACITLSYFNTLRTENFRIRIEGKLRIQRSKEYNHGLSSFMDETIEI